MRLTAAEREVVRLCGRVLLVAAACALLLSIAMLAAGHGASVLSVVAGFLIAAASFAILVWVTLRALPRPDDTAQRRGSAAAVAIIGCIKLAVLGALLWWLLRRSLVTPLAFLAGFSTMVLSLIAVGLSRKGAQETR